MTAKDAKLIAKIGLAIIITASAFLFDDSKKTISYEQNVTLAGVSGVWEIETGRLHLTRRENLVGYFGGGTARFVGFDCKGYDNPLIGVAAEPLAICDRVVALEA